MQVFSELDDESQADLTDGEELGDKGRLDRLQKKCFIFFVFAEVDDLRQKLQQLCQHALHR
jgi:hypothetical protein